MIRYLSTCLVLLFFLSCQSSNRENAEGVIVPDYIDTLKNLHVYDFSDSAFSDTVILQRELVLQDSDEVIFEAYISLFDLDDENNVYVVMEGPGHTSLSKFDSEGNFITKIGNMGRGPGEYRSIISIDIVNNKLYVLDSGLQKLIVFSTIDYSIINEMPINKNTALDKDLLKTMRASDILVVHDDLKLIKYRSLFGYEEDRRAYLHMIGDNGDVLGSNVLSLRSYLVYPPNEPLSPPLIPPFLRNTLVSYSNSGMIFTSWNEDFLVKAFDQNGVYQYSFYYPFSKSTLSINNLDLSSEELDVLRKYELPNTWPAIHTIEASNDDKLWVSTITDSDSTFKWYVLNMKGELQATFSMPGYRNKITILTKPSIKIKNGYFYEHEFDFSENIDRIIKYKIEFKER